METPEAGAVEQVADGIRAVLAPNPGPMTFTGTRTHIVGSGEVAVIDPGPDSVAHFDALFAAMLGERVKAVLVTHAHADHSAGAAAFARLAGAPVYAHGDVEGARSETMAALAAQGGIGGGEGLDRDFRPDIRLSDGEVLEGPDWHLQAVHTPGHLSDHLCFGFGEALFCGDLVMGWATTVISPPDGDLAAFRSSIARLQQRPESTYYPAHGKPVRNPQRLMKNLLRHRREREEQIIAVLERRPATPVEIMLELYAGVDASLHPAAARNVFAHLIDLAGRGILGAEGGVLRQDVRYNLIQANSGG